MPYDTTTSVRTLSLESVTLFPLKSQDINLYDIAHSLSMQCRFNGHVPEFLSVAEHSIAVANRVPEPFKKWALLHDATEAFVGDLISPLKSGLLAFRAIEDSIQQVIAERFGLPKEIPAIVHQADKDQAAAEMCRDHGCWADKPRNVEFMTPFEAREAFLSYAEALGIS